MNNRLFYKLPEGEYLLYNDYDLFKLTVGKYSSGDKMWKVKTVGSVGHGLYLHLMDLEDYYDREDDYNVDFKGISYRFNCSEEVHGTTLRGQFYPHKYSFYGVYSEDKLKELLNNKYWMRKGQTKSSDKIYRMTSHQAKIYKEHRKKWNL